MKKSILKEHNPWANISVIDMLSILDPSKTNKFLPFLIKYYKNINDNEVIDFIDRENYIDDIVRNFSIEEKRDTINNFTKLELDVFYRLSELINKKYNVREVLEEFNEHCNSYRIENNDITNYNDITEIIEANKKASFKILEKHKEQKVHVVLENENWLLIKPLTFESSLRYGASTKWCTAMKSNSDYYYRYSTRGVLIYIINKNTLVKTACFIPLDDNEGSYSNPLKLYNEADIETDSFMLDLDNHVMSVLINELNLKITNRSFIKKNYPEIFEQWENFNTMKGERYPTQDEVEIPIGDEGILEAPLDEDLLEAPYEFTVNNPNETLRFIANGNVGIGTMGSISNFEIRNEPSIDDYIKQIHEHMQTINPIRKFFTRFFIDSLITVGVPEREYDTIRRVQEYLNNDFQIKGYKFIVYSCQSNELVFTKL
jgi:hypothetical protein